MPVRMCSTIPILVRENSEWPRYVHVRSLTKYYLTLAPRLSVYFVVYVCIKVF